MKVTQAMLLKTQWLFTQCHLAVSRCAVPASPEQGARRAPARNQKVSSGGRAAVPQPKLVKNLKERHRWACCSVFWERFLSAC